MVACPKPRTMRSKYYRRWVERQPCCVDICGIDDETIAAHHAGIGGEAIKAPDNTCIALCHIDHMAIHALNGNGYFADIEDLDGWRDERIQETQERFIADDHKCETRGCGRGLDFEKDSVPKFFDDGQLLCHECRNPNDGPEWDKEGHLESLANTH